MSATLQKSPDALMTVRERHLKVPIVLAIAAAMLALLLLALPRVPDSLTELSETKQTRYEVEHFYRETSPFFFFCVQSRFKVHWTDGRTDDGMDDDGEGRGGIFN